jgi:hypothetical protein
MGKKPKPIVVSSADHLLRGQLQHQLGASNKEISAEAIYVAFVSLFPGANPATFPLDDPVGKWISPWPTFAPAFINQANNHPPFYQDNLGLTLRDISQAKEIGDVGNAIVDRFKKNGWSIT